MDILDLKENQHLKILNLEYIVLNKVKFVEKSSYWYEYKLRKVGTGEYYYLNVELDGKSILYKILDKKNIDLKINIDFDGCIYSIKEAGKGKIETYFGMTDVGLNEEVNYYEYANNSNLNEILSVEKWKDETEISKGIIVDSKNIKILNDYSI